MLQIVIIAFVVVYMVSSVRNKYQNQGSAVKKGCTAAALVVAAEFLVFIIFLVHIFSEMTQDTVLKKVYSPEKTYTAYVVDHGEGAVGDDEIRIYVEKTKKVNDKENYYGGKMVYTDEYGAKVNVRWKDENHIIINENEYYIDE